MRLIKFDDSSGAICKVQQIDFALKMLFLPLTVLTATEIRGAKLELITYGHLYRLRLRNLDFGFNRFENGTI